MPQRKPTKLQTKFVEEMANPNTKNQTDAARKAGFAKGSAKVTASRLLTNANLLERIEQRKQEAANFAKVTREAIIGATVQRAYASIDDAFDEDGHFSIEKARESGAIHLIKSITRSQNQFGENIKVEFYSKADAQDKLGNYFGLEKQPDVNPDTVERNKQTAESLITKWMERDGITREQAVDALVKIKPEAADWVM